MSREMLLLVDALAHEKNVSKAIVFAALEMALASAAKKHFQDDLDIVIKIDQGTGNFQSFRRWLVVPDDSIENPARQIALREALLREKKLSEGEYIPESIGSMPLDRIRAPAAKQVTFQKIRDAEREQNLSDCLERG